MPPDEDRYCVPFCSENLVDGYIIRDSGEAVPFDFSFGKPNESIDIEQYDMKEWKLFNMYDVYISTASCISKIVEDEIEYRKNNKFVSFEEMMGGIKE